ncbi:hypothetical protein SLEP1_g18598 [Rubroshorea leprosula]|uniref:Uncharacterized protein n=1 Tax=Rubroshorea leprosula TaxID=152421 RepID=A0AAV5J6Z5_9ROSI|nr:hypothetical protein SLEP1_g18598 [Rubroshorea leprosula]
MTEPVKETSSPDGTEELNLQQSELCINKNQEQPESSKSKRVRASEQGGSGAKVEASSDQPNKRGRKCTLTPAERKVRKNEGDRKRRNDRKIELGELRAMIPLFEDLKNKKGQLVRENKKLKSEITVMTQQMETRKNYKENKLTDMDIPLDLDFLNEKDFMFMIDDLSDAKLLEEIDALFPLPPPKGPATNKLITQGTGNLQTEVLEPDKEQIQAELVKIDNKIHSACCNEELATNKHVTAGKGTTEGALKLNGKGEDKPKEVLKGRLAMAVDDTSTCPPTGSTLSSSFMSNTCQSIRQFATALVTQNHLLSTAGGAELREAIHYKQASTSASCIKGTTDVLKLEKNMEACVSLAIQFAWEIASAQRESRAANTEEEYSANHAIETADKDN